jgi:hypothetical protein
MKGEETAKEREQRGDLRRQRLVEGGGERERERSCREGRRLFSVEQKQVGYHLGREKQDRRGIRTEEANTPPPQRLTGWIPYPCRPFGEGRENYQRRGGGGGRERGLK